MSEEAKQEGDFKIKKKRGRPKKLTEVAEDIAKVDYKAQEEQALKELSDQTAQFFWLRVVQVYSLIFILVIQVLRMRYQKVRLNMSFCRITLIPSTHQPR